MPGKQTSREMGTLMTVYSRKFSCLEHCATFYRMNENSTWAKWRSHAASAGKDFRYTIKAHRLFTHDNQLEINDYTRAHLAEFFAKVRLLGPHLGAVLVQLPPSFRKSEQSLDRLRALEAVFPKDIDFAFDLRSHTMICQEVADVLAQNNWAMVWYHLVDGSGEMELTTPFFDTSSKLVYIRLHGSVQQFSGDYGKEAMREWAQKVHEAVQSRPERDVYVFFNNNESRVGKLVSSLVDATCFTEQLNALGSGKPGAKLEPPSQAAVKAEQSAGPKSEPAGQSVKREPGAEPMATGAKRPGSDDLASAPKRAKAAPAASEAAAAAAADGDSKQPASADEELSQEVVHIETPASAPKRAKAAPVASEAAAAVAVKRAKKASTRKAAGNNKAKA
ncbi:hypothetical protein DIPPA_24442 [Diplonema papillatum]|nr:hypothetical protein DIPPA_24442 [Diplonema papillatum]